MATQITMPTFGVEGLPADTKDNLRADFRANEFEKLIEVKGYRLAWERASLCPCKPINDQTLQTDPNCTLCDGAGWLWFGPAGYVADQDKVGTLDDCQQLVVQKNGAAVIKGIMTNLQNMLEPFDKLGHWMSGTSVVTVRHENKLGYYDRITGLDSEIVYAEAFEQGVDPNALVELRYVARAVNFLRSLDQRFDDTDFELEAGKIKWKAGKAPKSGTRVVAHYLTYPVWLIVDHPHTVRQTLIKRKVTSPTTPLGNPVNLPIQAMVRYEFIPQP